MHFNWMLIPTVLGALALAFLGRKVSGERGKSATQFVASILAIPLALPAFLLVAYHFHLLDNAVWFYAFRTMPYSELSASGIGLGAGLIWNGLKPKTSDDGSFRSSVLAIVTGLFLSASF